jgi:hypothetical protein
LSEEQHIVDDEAEKWFELKVGWASGAVFKNFLDLFDSSILMNKVSPW